MSLKRHRRFFLFLISLLSISIEITGHALRDLESNIPDFVLETKKLEIPGCPDAFNPSIVRWKGSLLMSFRIRDPVTLLTNQIGFIWLDEEFNPKSLPQILQMEAGHSPLAMTQDPRLVEIDSKLYMAYNEFCPASTGSNRRMTYSRLIEEQGFFLLTPPTICWILMDRIQINRKKTGCLSIIMAT